jgi:hypothetical protein
VPQPVDQKLVQVGPSFGLHSEEPTLEVWRVYLLLYYLWPHDEQQNFQSTSFGLLTCYCSNSWLFCAQTSLIIVLVKICGPINWGNYWHHKTISAVGPGIVCNCESPRVWFRVWGPEWRCKSYGSSTCSRISVSSSDHAGLHNCVNDRAYVLPWLQALA